jgi:hypothetical protein
VRPGREKKDSSFSEEKEAKRLFPQGVGCSDRCYQRTKSFLVLFFKKELFLPCARTRRPPGTPP